MTARQTRKDALPEHSSYTDTGCELSPTCLRCPLPICVYEQPQAAFGYRLRERDQLIFERRAQGAGIATLCIEFSISRRTVFRVLARRRLPASSATTPPVA